MVLSKIIYCSSRLQRADIESLNQKNEQPKSMKIALLRNTLSSELAFNSQCAKGAWISLHPPSPPYSCTTSGTKFGGAYPLKYKFKKSLPDKFSLLRRFYCLNCQEVRAVGICKISQTVSWHHMREPKWALMQMEKRNKKRQTRLSQCVGGAQSKHRLLSSRSGILLEYYFWKLAVFTFEKKLQHPLPAQVKKWTNMQTYLYCKKKNKKRKLLKFYLL